MASNDEQEKQRRVQAKLDEIQQVVEYDFLNRKDVKETRAKVERLYEEILSLDPGALGGASPKEAAQSYVQNNAASRYADLYHRDKQSGKERADFRELREEIISLGFSKEDAKETLVSADYLETFLLDAKEDDVFSERETILQRPRHSSREGAAYIPSVADAKAYAKWDAHYESHRRQNRPKPTPQPAPATNVATDSDAGAALAIPPDALDARSGLDLTSDAGAAFASAPDALDVGSGLDLTVDAAPTSAPPTPRRDERSQAGADDAGAPLDDDAIAAILADRARKTVLPAHVETLADEANDSFGVVDMRRARAIAQKALDIYNGSGALAADAGAATAMPPEALVGSEGRDLTSEAGAGSSLSMPTGNDVASDPDDAARAKLREQEKERIAQEIRDYYKQAIQDGKSSEALNADLHWQKLLQDFRNVAVNMQEFTDMIDKLSKSLNQAAEAAENASDSIEDASEKAKSPSEPTRRRGGRKGRQAEERRSMADMDEWELDELDEDFLTDGFSLEQLVEAVDAAYQDPDWLALRDNERRVMKIINDNGWDFRVHPLVYRELFERYSDESRANGRPPLPQTDEWGYRPIDWENRRVHPEYREAEKRTPNGEFDLNAERSRVRTQSVLEEILEGRRFASDSYVKDLAREKGIHPNSTYAQIGDVRDAMGLGDVDPVTQRYADAYYRLQDYLNLSPKEMLFYQSKSRPYAKGRSVDSIFERWFPFSSYNLEKKDAERDYAKAQKAFDEIESQKQAGAYYDQEEYDKRKQDRDEKKRRRDAYANGKVPERRATNAEARAEAQAALEELKEKFDPATGQILSDQPLSEGAANLVNAKGIEEVDRAARAAAGTKSGYNPAQGVQSVAELLSVKGMSKVAGSMFGGSGAAAGAAKAAGVAGIIIAVVGACVGLFKKLNAIVEQTTRSFEKFVPLNGAVASATAMYEGEKFMRDVALAENTSESSVDAIEARNRREEEWQPFREAWAEFKAEFAVVWNEILIDLAKDIKAMLPLIRAIAWLLEQIAKGFRVIHAAGKVALPFASGAAKSAIDAIFGTFGLPFFSGFFKRKLEEQANEENEKQKEESHSEAKDTKKDRERFAREKAEAYEAQKTEADNRDAQVFYSGKIARAILSGEKYDWSDVEKSSFVFNTALVDPKRSREENQKALEKWVKSSETFERDAVEDYIAFYDFKSRGGKFQHYRDLNEGEKPNDRYLEKILHTLQNAHVAQIRQEKILENSLKTSKEIAEAVAKSDNPLLTSNIFDAMWQVANRYAVDPKKTTFALGADRVFSPHWGAEGGGWGRNAQYGRFAKDPRRTGQIPNKPIPPIPNGNDDE